MRAIGIRTASEQPPPAPLRLMSSPPAAPPDWGPRFQACFETHYRRVLAYALRRTADRASAEDIAAETFLVAWRRLEHLPDDDALPWLQAIARNLLLNERRTSRRRDRLAVRLASVPAAPADDAGRSPAGPADTADTADGDETTARVRAALAQLSERDREVLLLTTWDGLDRRRAAVVLGCSPATFAVRLHRARARLARILQTTADGRPS